MLSQSRSLEFLIVQSIFYSKLYFTFWAWLDYKHLNSFYFQGYDLESLAFSFQVMLSNEFF